MDVWSAPVRDLRPLLSQGRAALVARLSDRPASAWAAPTEAGHWTVGDVARHLLGGDLGLLSRWRDGDRSGLIPVDGDHAAFVARLDAANQRWVEAAATLSPRVVAGLLAWSGAEVDAFLATVDLTAARHVGWAGGAVPAWLDIAREHTERWVHARHITDALAPGQRRGDRPGEGPGGRLVAPDPELVEVLRTFVWAFPAQLGPAADGTAVAVRLGADHWTLHRREGHWSLLPGAASSPAASLELDPEPAWRQLTGLPVAAESVQAAGAPDLAAALLAVRAILV